MNIDPKSMICGIPALDAKKLMLLLRQKKQFYVININDFLKCSSENSLIVLSDLVQSCYIQETNNDEKDSSYSVTEKGSLLAMASTSKPYKRKSVENTLNKFMLRVKRVNKNEDYLHGVSKVIIFGSYLGTKEFLGDLNIVVQLKVKNLAEYRTKHNELIELAEENGVNFPDFYYKENYSYHMTSSYLKSRSRIISLHDMEREASLIDTLEHKVIFETEL